MSSCNVLIVNFVFNSSKSSLEDSCNFYRHEFIMPFIAFTALKGQITISSDPSPLFGIQFLAIPFAFDFAFKMHSKEKSFKNSIN